MLPEPSVDSGDQWSVLTDLQTVLSAHIRSHLQREQRPLPYARSASYHVEPEQEDCSSGPKVGEVVRDVMDICVKAKIFGVEHTSVC